MICPEQGLDLQPQGSGDGAPADLEILFLGKIDLTVAVGHGPAGFQITFPLSNCVALVVLSTPFSERQLYFGFAVSKVDRQGNQLQRFLFGA